MARITTYELDSNISLNDKLVGTDADDNSITKNYSVDALGEGLISLKNIITGTGTLNTIPMFTPDGATIGDSIMFTKSNGTEIQVGVHPSLAQTTLGAGFVSSYAVGADVVTATNINAGAFGTLTASGNIILGDATADTTTINSTLIINSVVQDSNQTLGTDGQILAANAASELLWVDNNVLTSPGGIQFRIVVDEAGNLSTTPL
jgi:hypothetical protein